MAWGAIIWMFSTEYFSGSGTGRILLPILEFLVPGASTQSLTSAHLVVRKLAHLGEYAVLALLVFRALNTSQRSSALVFTMALALCAAYASVDEVHQVFVGSRVGALSDVLLDTLGAGLGLAGVAVWRFSLGRRLPT